MPIGRLSRLARHTLGFGAAAIVVYCTMVFGPLATLQELAGAPPLDIRPVGYSDAEARAFLEALGEEGRSLYLTRQIPLDMVYPALMALTLAGLYRLLGVPLGASTSVRLGVGLSWVAALCDYAENLSIARALALWPDVPASILNAANVATLSKSAATTLAVLGLLVLIALRVVARRG